MNNKKAPRFKFELDHSMTNYVTNLANHLGETDKEAIFQLRAVAYLLGYPLTNKVLQSTLRLTIKEGKTYTYQTADKTTYKRTIGGVFFKLAKTTMSSTQRYLFCHFRDCYRGRKKS